MTGNRLGLNVRRSGLRKWVAPMVIFVPFDIDAKINSAYVTKGCFMARKIFIGQLMFRHVADKILIAMRLLLPAYWVQCLDIVIFRNYGKKVFTK